MALLRLNSDGSLRSADVPRPDTRRGRHRESGRAFRSTSAYQRLRDQVFREEPCCAICGSEREPNLDHIVPVAKGGSRYDRLNARRLCGDCNRRKGAG